MGNSINIPPPELAALDRWVVWRYERRGEDPKPTKVPYRADGRGRASSTDPETWGTYAAAVGRLAANPNLTGLGLVLGDGLWGLDLDGCCPVPFGPLVPEADTLVRALATYAEHSPSGTGAHALAWGAHPAAAKNRAPLTPAVNAEAYGAGRYFTFTGRRIAGAPLAITEQQWAIDAMCRPPGLFAFTEPVRRLSLTPPSVRSAAVEASDAELMKRAFASRSGEAVRTLYSGADSGHSSASEADMALCSHLLYWCDGDTARADRLFRASGRMRPKWDERRGSHADGSALTYGERTLASVAPVASVRSVTPSGSVTAPPRPSIRQKYPTDTLSF